MAKFRTDGTAFLPDYIFLPTFDPDGVSRKFYGLSLYGRFIWIFIAKFRTDGTAFLPDYIFLPTFDPDGVSRKFYGLSLCGRLI
jgi:hypothetical protein